MAKEIGREPDIAKKYSFLKQLKDIWFYLEGHRTQAIILLAITIISALISLIPPYLYGLIINALTVLDMHKVILYLIITALSYIVYRLINGTSLYFSKMLAWRVKNNSRIRNLNYLMKLDYDFYENNSMGKILSRIDSGTSSLRETMRVLYSTTSIQFFTMIFSVFLIFSINFTLGITSILIILYFLTYNFYTIKRSLNLENEAFIASEKTYGKIYDFFSHVLIIKFLNISRKLTKILENSSNIILSKIKAQRKYERIRIASSNLTIDLSSVLILGIISFFVFKGQMNIGIAVMAFGFFNKITGSVSRIWDDYSTLLEHRTSMYRMSLIYNEKPKIKEPLNPQIPDKWESLDISDISYKYNSGLEYALNDISLKIKKGERIAIVGLSGSGKSTLTKLIMKLYLPNKGSIKIGDININNIPSEVLYNLIKIVPQENELMNASILENLKIASNNNVSKQDALRVLQQSSSIDFVNKMPKGINTLIGPNGMKISGGEKQRLCIARALISNPQVLILDEASSHLDVITEKKIHETLRSLPSEITIIAVTHRISSLNLFDRIIVMDKGKIVGDGTHNTLLRTNKIYKQLYEVSKREELKI